MTEQLTGYEASSVAEIEAILDAMPADADTVYLDTIGYSERAIAAVAAKRAGGGAGGPWGTVSGTHFSGSGKPSGVTPTAKGDLYVDVTTPALYQATGLSTADWVAVPNVIQGTDPGAQVLTIRTPNDQTAHALAVVNADNDDCFSVGGTSGVTLSADAIGGTSELQITTNALTFKDEGGDTVIDIEGGFTNLGPGGEVSVAAGQVYAVLPSGNPGNPGQLYQVAGVVHVSL